MIISLELRQTAKVDNLLENEPDVTKRGDILGHNPG
jgi:hypothetical protein